MVAFLTLGTISSFTIGVLLLIVFTYFATYYFVYLRQIKRWEQSNIPYLQPTFLLGHKQLVNAAKYTVGMPLDQIYKENPGKDLIGFFMGTIPMILLRDPKLIREIGAKYASQTFDTGFSLPESEIEAQYSINLTTDKEKWKFGRTTLTPLFSINWFQGPRFERIKESINEIWCKAEKSELENSPLNITEVTKNALLHILDSNFGIDEHSNTLKNNLRAIVDEFFTPSYRVTIVSLFVSIFPSLQKFEYFKFVTPKMRNNMAEILNYQISQRDQANHKTGDLIDILRSLRTNENARSTSNMDSALLSSDEETSRLFPTLFYMRQCSEDFQIQGTKYVLKKGDKLIITPYSISRDETIFPNPLLFDPERFNSKDSSLTLPATLVGFGSGLRKCPGYRYGLFVAAAILGSLLLKYEIKPRSHLKLMDVTDFDPRGLLNAPKEKIFVDLVRWETSGDN